MLHLQCPWVHRPGVSRWGWCRSREGSVEFCAPLWQPVKRREEAAGWRRGRRGEIGEWRVGGRVEEVIYNHHGIILSYTTISLPHSYQCLLSSLSSFWTLPPPLLFSGIMALCQLWIEADNDAGFGPVHIQHATHHLTSHLNMNTWRRESIISRICSCIW